MSPEMNLKKNLVYNSILSLSQVLFPLITIPYISRVLDPEGVGRVGFIDSYTYFFTVVAEFGIITYGVREIVKLKDDPIALKKLVSELFLIQLIASGITSVIYLTGIFILWQKIGDLRLIAFSVAFFIANFFYCEWYFWGKEAFRYIAIRSILIRVAGVVCIFLLINTPQDYYIYYGIITISAIIGLVWNFSILFKEIKPVFRGLSIRKHIPQLLMMNGVTLGYSIFLMLDTPLLRLSNTEKAVGFYIFAIKIIRTGSAVITDLLLVLYPHTVDLINTSSTEAVKRKIHQSSQLMLLLSIPLTTGIFLLADSITQVYLGPAFSPVAINLQILAIFPVISTFELFLNRQVLLSYHKEKQVMTLMLVSGFIFITTTILLSTFYGDKGASIAIVMAEILLLIFSYYQVRQLKMGFTFIEWKNIFQIISGVILFLPVIYFNKTFIDTKWLELVCNIAGCILIYFGWLIFVVKNTIALQLYEMFRSVIKTGSISGK